jgi:hypothetical protein
MKKYTHYSFYYLAGYLSLTGIALLLAPEASLKLLLSNREYDDVFVRFTGSFMIALSIIVIQIIRHRLEVLYTTTLFVRAFFIICIISFYVQTKDPLFLVILAVVGLGFILTAGGYLTDKRVSKTRCQ